MKIERFIKILNKNYKKGDLMGWEGHKSLISLKW